MQSVLGLNVLISLDFLLLVQDFVHFLMVYHQLLFVVLLQLFEIVLSLILQLLDLLHLFDDLRDVSLFFTHLSLSFLVVNFSRNFRGLQNAVKFFALLEQACCFRKVFPAGFAYRRGKTRQPP